MYDLVVFCDGSGTWRCAIDVGQTGDLRGATLYTNYSIFVLSFTCLASRTRARAALLTNPRLSDRDNRMSDNISFNSLTIGVCGRKNVAN